ncbi:capsular polysaccharide synthesis protein, partial [Levilactobacillus yiduensis]|uniref:capsular polysaccharide synthesis protein n=1 Tax=Levilactobacillus yiduensis TaxID=2953880 RepID=UPI0021579748
LLSNPLRTPWYQYLVQMANLFLQFAFQKSLSILLEYWKKNNAVIDYFLLDYVMKYVYDSNTSVRKKVDSVTKSSTNVFGINQLLRQKYSAENMFKLEKEIESDGIFKLSYKIKFKNDSLYKFWERTSL